MKKTTGIIFVTLAILAANSHAATTTASMKKGVRITSDDGNFKFRIGGRLHADIASYNEDQTPLEDNNIIRRARLGVSGKMYKDWRFRTDYDFSAKSDFRIKGTWLQYTGAKPYKITVGNIQEPISLEEMTSSNTITFMERAIISAFTPSYHLGTLVTRSGKDWSAAGGYFGKTIGEQSTQKISSGWGMVGRVTFAPVKEKKRALHLGVSSEYREPDSNSVRYSARPESYATSARLVNTRTIRNVDSTLIYGLEGALIQGPWSFQGEYIRSSVQRNNATDLTFDGWYAYASWFVTGESRRYNAKKGNFRPIKPKAKTGAWELATRYSTIDLSDANTNNRVSGQLDNITLAVNWYLNRNVRLMANYILVNADPNRDGVKDKPRILQMRAQVFF